MSAPRAAYAAVLSVSLIGMSVLPLSLRPDAFFSGDSGLKLIAARNALAHPARPFEIDLPVIGGERVADVDPMIGLHGDHGHALQSPVFPAVSAPLIAAAGLRGAYILPALGFVLLLPLLDAIRRRIAPDASSWILAGIVVLANPAFFYALEFWEHAPATALVAASLAAALAAEQSRGTGRGWAVVGGALGGTAVLLRPEAAWAVAGIGLVMTRGEWLAFGGGAAVVLAPFAATNYLHSGTPLGPHASANLAPLQGDWLAARWQRIDTWFAPLSPAVAASLVLVAGAWMLRGIDIAKRQAVAIVGVAVIAVLAAGRWLPRESFWQGFPLALLAFVPVRRSPAARRLALVAAGAGAGVILTATHDGGAQWGTRFLLVAAPPLLLLVAVAATDLSRAGTWRAARVGLLAIVMIAGLLTTRAAYLELRGSKQFYGRLVDAVAAATRPGEVIVTNVWWLDQVAAALSTDRQFLYASTVGDAEAAVAHLRRAGAPSVALAWTEEPDGESLAPGPSVACIRQDPVREVTERSLRIVHCEVTARREPR